MDRRSSPAARPSPPPSSSGPFGARGEAIAHAYATTTTRYPELNVLVNMAGIMMPERVLDPGSLPVAESTVTTNLLGPIRMVSAFASFLARRDDAVIMNVSSGPAFVPLPWTPTYSATKAAVHSFTDSLRVQLADTGVQVIELIPPLVATALMGSDRNPMAMPLEDFLAASMTILDTQPDVQEIIVERVERQRFAERRGAYGEVLAMLSALA